MLVTLRILSSTSAQLCKVATNRFLVFMSIPQPLANTPKLLSDLIIVSSMTMSVHSPAQDLFVVRTQLNPSSTIVKAKDTQFLVLPSFVDAVWHFSRNLYVQLLPKDSVYFQLPTNALSNNQFLKIL